MFKNFLQIILEKSKKITDEVPVVCLIVDSDNKILARAVNQVERKNNPCLHAEIIAIKKALKKKIQTENTKYRYLEDCSLYVNLEPCIMCGYAISLARVKNVFFAARDQRFGFFSKNIDSSHKVKHFQLMEDEGRRIFDSFFRSKRN